MTMLKLYNKTQSSVEYAFTENPNRPPLTTVVVPPGGMKITYPYVNRDYIWFRYYGVNMWPQPPVLIGDFGVPVYWWKFIPQGSGIGLVGAFEEVGH